MSSKFRSAQPGALSLIALIAVAWVTTAQGDNYSDQWGPASGQPIPVLDAPDHQGNARTLENLRGKRGLLLFMNRSTDW